MHVIKIWQLQKHVARDHLQATPGVGRIIAQDPRAQPIGKPRGDPLDERVATIDAVTSKQLDPCRITFRPFKS